MTCVACILRLLTSFYTISAKTLTFVDIIYMIGKSCPSLTGLSVIFTAKLTAKLILTLLSLSLKLPYYSTYLFISPLSRVIFVYLIYIYPFITEYLKLLITKTYIRTLFESSPSYATRPVKNTILYSLFLVRSYSSPYNSF